MMNSRRLIASPEAQDHANLDFNAAIKPGISPRRNTNLRCKN